MFNFLKDLNRQVGILLLIALFTSCKEEKGIPFPENASGFKVPVTKPFTMPEAKPFVWRPIDPLIIPKGITIPLNFDKLPYKNFSINGFKPLKAALTTQPLNWKNLEEIKINLDTIKGKAVVRKFKLLPEPIITKVSPLKKWENTTSDILKFGLSEGLQGNWITTMVTDNYGSIWIATESGLSKYGGDEIKTYDFLKGAAGSRAKIITDLEIDQNGQLLITAYESGLYKLDIPTGIIEHFDIGSGFGRIREDHQGVIWLGNPEKGLYFFKPGQDSIYQLVVPSKGINNSKSLGCFEDSNNNMWFGFPGNVVIINSERTSLKLLPGDQSNQNTPRDFTEDGNGAVWLSSPGKGAKSVSIAEDKISMLGSDQGFAGVAKGIIKDRLKRIWIMDDDTVTIYDPSKSRMKKIPTQVPYGYWASSMQDKNGMIWIATQSIGVLIADALGPLAEHFDKSNGLVHNIVRDVEEDQQERIWMATYGGINVYDPKKERLYYLKDLEQFKPNRYESISRLPDGRLVAGSFGNISIIDLGKNTITVYLSEKISGYFPGAGHDGAGNLLVASSSGVIRFSPEKGTWHQLDKNAGLASNNVWHIFPYSESHVWLLTDVGINVIDTKAETIAFIDKKNGLSSDQVITGFQTNKDEILIGGDKGLSIINKERTQITNLTSAEGLIPQTIFDVVEFNGKIRMGSTNGLIIAQRPASNDSIWRFTNYGKGEGFPFSDYAQLGSMYTKNETSWHPGALIVSIIHQEPLINDSSPTVQITGINIMDQHPSFQDVNYLTAFIQQGDTIWNSTETKFLTKDARHDDTTYLAINKIKWDSIQASTQMPFGLKLPHTQNSLSFTFANLDMRGRDKIVYRYVLEGNDNKWSEINSKPGSKNYYNLLPGDYTFKVATRGFNGVWSEPAEFAFTILPPWWETWWFRLLSVIALIIVVYAIVQERSRNLKKQNLQLEEKVLVRTKELKLSLEELRAAQAQLIQSEKMASLGELTAGIAHEIQNPLNFVNNFSEVNTELIEEMKKELAMGNQQLAEVLADDIKANQEKINHHGKRAAGIVKGMLQHSRNSSGVQEPTNINDLADEYLRLAYHGLRAKDKTFNAVMKSDFDESIGSIIVVPQDMGRVILNLITNAFYAVTEKKKQAEDGYEPTVTVSTKRGNGNVSIHVKDNGNGIPQQVVDKIFQPFFTTKPTGQGTGLGLSMSYDIVKAHGGDIIVETKSGEGSEFRIEIPDNRYQG